VSSQRFVLLLSVPSKVIMTCNEHRVRTKRNDAAMRDEVDRILALGLCQIIKLVFAKISKFELPSVTNWFLV